MKTGKVKYKGLALFSKKIMNNTIKKLLVDFNKC